MFGKREREREKISKFEKFVVGPFAVGNEINTSSFDKKKKVSKKSKRRKRRNVVFSNDSFIPSLSTSRVFFCFATPLLYISYLPSSSSNPSFPLYYTIPSTFVRPCLIRGRPFPTSAIPLPQISPTTILSRHVLTPMRIRENLSLHSLLPSSHRAISSS